MIRTFSVENSLSIRERQELSFVSKETDSMLVKEMPDGTFLYKLGIFYGPNASGKSNILFAINEVFRILVRAKSDTKEKIAGYIPFALNESEPTRMSVSFYADNVRYDYKVEFNKTTILYEELNYYPNKSKSLFYERRFAGDDIQAEIKFGSSLHLQAATQRSIRENTLRNHSVLSICSKKSFEKDIAPLTKLHNWVMLHYHEVDGDFIEDRSVVDILTDAMSDKRKHNFFKIMLNKADLNITDFINIVENRIITPEMREMANREDLPDVVRDELLKPVKESVAFQNYTNAGLFNLPVHLQSKGTIKFIKILDALYDLISSNHVYYLDELGEDLHHDLLFYYLSVFLYNSDQSQLLITSQEVALMLEDIINENRGSVWFVDKNRETASSEYNRADTYGLHKNLSLYNSYCIGRLGAKPQLGSFFINLED